MSGKNQKESQIKQKMSKLATYVCGAMGFIFMALAGGACDSGQSLSIIVLFAALTIICFGGTYVFYRKSTEMSE